MSWLDDVVSRIRSSKSRTFRQSHGLKFGMVGTYNTYFPNIKRKGKVSFDHSTTSNKSKYIDKNQT